MKQHAPEQFAAYNDAVYRAMADGSLERDFLDAWITDLYAHWDGLYRAVGGAFVKNNIEDVRSRVLVKLVNIEGKI